MGTDSHFLNACNIGIIIFPIPPCTHWTAWVWREVAPGAPPHLAQQDCVLWWSQVFSAVSFSLRVLKTCGISMKLIPLHALEKDKSSPSPPWDDDQTHCVSRLTTESFPERTRGCMGFLSHCSKIIIFGSLGTKQLHEARSYRTFCSQKFPASPLTNTELQELRTQTLTSNPCWISITEQPVCVKLSPCSAWCSRLVNRSAQSWLIPQTSALPPAASSSWKSKLIPCSYWLRNGWKKAQSNVFGFSHEFVSAPRWTAASS